jgi:catechol 2,3-dioxygenase-like lactoylglutathione lyase family enzyme
LTAANGRARENLAGRAQDDFFGCSIVNDETETEMVRFPIPQSIVLTHFVVSKDIPRSRRFYTDVLGGEVVLGGEPTIVALANSWIIINVGGPPTDDKPAVTLTVPDPHVVSSFLNIRVANIQETYDDWSSKGAQFLTPPVDRGPEFRCYLHDPDGHLIEVGQTKREFLKQEEAE